MRRIKCPKCNAEMLVDATKLSPNTLVVIICTHCGARFGIRAQAAVSHYTTACQYGYIEVIENVFCYRQEIPLRLGDNVIGRKNAAGEGPTLIESSDRSMDRCHCVINVKRDSQGELIYTLMDCGSVTGTFLNNELLQSKDRIRVTNGAVVTLGATTFILHAY